MRMLAALCKLLTILSIIGLVIGGVTPAVGAGTMAVMAMPEDMPPCGDMNEAGGDMMQTCPFQTVCVASCPQATLPDASIRFLLLANAGSMLSDLLGGSSLTHAPPARPPKA